MNTLALDAAVVAVQPLEALLMHFAAVPDFVVVVLLVVAVVLAVVAFVVAAVVAQLRAHHQSIDSISCISNIQTYN